MGQSASGRGSIGERLKKHTTDHLSGHWKQFSWFGICPFDASGKLKDPQPADKTNLLNALEGLLITVLNPQFNKAEAPNWREAKDLLQV